jgi:hypothetical protein
MSDTLSLPELIDQIPPNLNPQCIDLPTTDCGQATVENPQLSPHCTSAPYRWVTRRESVHGQSRDPHLARQQDWPPQEAVAPREKDIRTSPKRDAEPWMKARVDRRCA